MRIRYHMAGDMGHAVLCDLPDKKARKKFEELKRNGVCEWAELVGEDDDNYMEILDQFDKTESARQLYCIMKSIIG